MRVDLGAISVGQSVEGGLMFQYFCWEWEGETRVVGAFIQDTSEYENSPDYSFSTNPGPCEVVTEVHNYLFWEVTPGEPGFHRCAAWFEAEYGYYDFEFVIEAYEPSDEPVQLVTDCLEPPEVLNIDIPMDRVYLYQPLVFRATCSLSYGREHLVVTRVDIEGDEDGVFELGDWPVSGRGFSPLSPGDDCYVIHIGFFPTAPGTFWAEAIIHTNEPAGEHRVLLVGISRG